MKLDDFHINSEEKKWWEEYAENFSDDEIWRLGRLLESTYSHPRNGWAVPNINHARLTYHEVDHMRKIVKKLPEHAIAILLADLYKKIQRYESQRDYFVDYARCCKCGAGYLLPLKERQKLIKRYPRVKIMEKETLTS